MNILEVLFVLFSLGENGDLDFNLKLSVLKKSTFSITDLVLCVNGWIALITDLVCM